MHGGEQQRVLVVGAGGHAKVCIDVLRGLPGIEVVGAVSRDGTGVDGLGVPMLGIDEEVGDLAERAAATSFCVAIGNNEHRRTWMERLTARGRPLVTLSATSAVVSSMAVLGEGVQVMPAAVINAGTAIGTGTIVNTNATVDHDNLIGACSHIAPGSALGGDVRVGSGVLIGIGARVLPGVTIGDDVTVGGGAVVIDDVPDGVTVVGVPARVVEGSR